MGNTVGIKNTHSKFTFINIFSPWSIHSIVTSHLFMRTNEIMSVKQFELLRKSRLYNLRDEFDKLDSQISALAQSLYQRKRLCHFPQLMPIYLKSSTHNSLLYNFWRTSFGLHPVNFASRFSIFYPIFHWPITSLKSQMIKNQNLSVFDLSYS